MTASVKACHAASRLGRIVHKALEASELSPGAYRLMGHLAIGGEIAATVLADKLLVSRPTVTASVDWLEARGMVVRTPDPDDARRVRITATQKGERARRHADALLAGRLAEVLDHLDPKTAEGILESLEQLHDAMVADTLRRHEASMKSDG